MTSKAADTSADCGVVLCSFCCLGCISVPVSFLCLPSFVPLSLWVAVCLCLSSVLRACGLVRLSLVSLFSVVVSALARLETAACPRGRLSEAPQYDYLTFLRFVFLSFVLGTQWCPQPNARQKSFVHIAVLAVWVDIDTARRF